MADPWPWLAIAGAGALHGLSPANGWLLAATCGVQATGAGWRRTVARAGIVVAAFALTIGHGTGALLVPVLAPWCGTGAAAGMAAPSRSLLVAVAAVAVHTAAMLLAMRLVALSAWRLAAFAYPAAAIHIARPTPAVTRTKAMPSRERKDGPSLPSGGEDSREECMARR